MAIDESSVLGTHSGMRRIIGFTAALVAAFTVVAGPAYAAVPETGFRLADDSSHTYCWGSGSFTTASHRAAANYGMDYLDSGTQMSTTLQTCQGGSTDIYFWYFNDNNIRGLYDCVNIRSGRCISANIYMNFAELDEGSNDTEDRQKTAIHEIGHSIGFKHDAQHTDCAMRSGEIPSTSIAWRRYSGFDINSINAAY